MDDGLHGPGTDTVAVTGQLIHQGHPVDRPLARVEKNVHSNEAEKQTAQPDQSRYCGSISRSKTITSRGPCSIGIVVRYREAKLSHPVDLAQEERELLTRRPGAGFRSEALCHTGQIRRLISPSSHFMLPPARGAGIDSSPTPGSGLDRKCVTFRLARERYGRPRAAPQRRVNVETEWTSDLLTCLPL